MLIEIQILGRTTLEYIMSKRYIQNVEHEYKRNHTVEISLRIVVSVLSTVLTMVELTESLFSF